MEGSWTFLWPTQCPMHKVLPGANNSFAYRGFRVIYIPEDRAMPQVIKIHSGKESLNPLQETGSQRGGRERKACLLEPWTKVLWLA